MHHSCCSESCVDASGNRHPATMRTEGKHLFSVTEVQSVETDSDITHWKVWDKAAYVSCHARPRAFQFLGFFW